MSFPGCSSSSLGFQRESNDYIIHCLGLLSPNPLPVRDHAVLLTPRFGAPSSYMQPMSDASGIRYAADAKTF